MDLKLKQIKVNTDLSADSYCFTALLYVNGYKTALVTNGGQGQDTEINPFNAKALKKVERVEKYCSTLDPHIDASIKVNGSMLIIHRTLANLIYDLVHTHLLSEKMKG
ncbi:hypothetical protein PV783_14050 [Chitinophaga sp. CC14]